jgi:phosphatidylserine/phosphatidylglycerophosphate/cardiolipin synthase-like enzyme
MLGEATLDVSGTFLGEAIRLLILFAAQHTDHFWKTDWPGSSRPSVFYDPRALDPEAPGGVLHAKAVVADDQAVFITSANLTGAALDRNIELGVLLRDRALALTVSGYFRSLIDRDLLKPLPLA